MSIVRLIFMFFLLISNVISPTVKVASIDEKSEFYEWTQETEFSDDYYITLEKEPGRDFVILNLTDIQLQDHEIYGKEGLLAERTIRTLVGEVKPDLITVTGDNAWSTMAYVQTVQTLDSFGIPWAPVMGNHDGQGCISELWCAELFTDCDNCLFEFGPEGMGYGNYIICITENGEIIHTIYMMDSHSSASDAESDGSNGTTGYDHFWKNQISWFEWAADGIAAEAGKEVESTVFMHIPVYEYRTAWEEAGYDEATGKFTGEGYEDATGRKFDPVCSADVNNGFFDVAKAHGVTMMVSGHDHINDFVIDYEGVTLAYGVKTGAGCYWREDMNGGSRITIASDGGNEIEQLYINPSDVGWDFKWF